VTDEDVDGMLDTLRKQQANWKEKEGAVDAEDRVTIDFTGSVDGEEFEGGKASDFVLAMGQGRMIPASKTVSKATRLAKSSPST
jgi:trigger factor